MSLPRPRPGDSAIAAVAAAALSVDGIRRGLEPPGVIVSLACLACAPLLWRTRAPLAAMLGVAIGLVICLLTFHPYDTAIFVAMVSLYAVALLGDRRRSVLVAGAWMAFLAAVFAMVLPRGDSGQAAFTLLLALVAVAAGDVVRSRRALVAAVAEREEQREREHAREQERSLVGERLRIARDLHDTVAHALVAINVRAGVAAHLAGDNDPDGALADISAVSAEALEDLRRTLGLLRDPADPADPAPNRPGTPAPLGLDRAAVRSLLDRARAAGLEADADIDLSGERLPAGVEHAGYRILQEALTNVMRHAAATHASITLKVSHDVLHIDVVDDGTGRQPDGADAHGHGLQGMAERAAALGGAVTAGPGTFGGWEVHARLPLTSAAAR